MQYAHHLTVGIAVLFVEQTILTTRLWSARSQDLCGNTLNIAAASIAATLICVLRVAMLH